MPETRSSSGSGGRGRERSRSRDELRVALKAMSAAAGLAILGPRVVVDNAEEERRRRRAARFGAPATAPIVAVKQEQSSKSPERAARQPASRSKSPARPERAKEPPPSPRLSAAAVSAAALAVAKVACREAAAASDGRKATKLTKVGPDNVAKTKSGSGLSNDVPLGVSLGSSWEAALRAAEETSGSSRDRGKGGGKEGFDDEDEEDDVAEELLAESDEDSKGSRSRSVSRSRGRGILKRIARRGRDQPEPARKRLVLTAATKDVSMDGGGDKSCNDDCEARRLRPISHNIVRLNGTGSAGKDDESEVGPLGEHNKVRSGGSGGSAPTTVPPPPPPPPPQDFVGNYPPPLVVGAGATGEGLASFPGVQLPPPPPLVVAGGFIVPPSLTSTPSCGSSFVPPALGMGMHRPVPPHLPGCPLPAVTKVIVSVPVKVRAHAASTLADLRKNLLLKGCKVATGVFHCRGITDVIEDDTRIQDLPDMRLIITPEPDLKPWQRRVGHAKIQQMVAARGVFNVGSGQGGSMSFEAVAARHPLYKTKLCNMWFSKGGRCPRGLRCVFAHGPGELRQRGQGFQVLPGMVRPPGSFPQRPGFAGMMPNLGNGPVGTMAVGQPGVVAPEPTLEFTVDEEEEKRRAERAKRFAARPASFEAEEAEQARKAVAKEDGEEGDDAANELGDETAGAETNASSSSVCSGDFVFPPPPGIPLGINLEAQIADYITEMEQQFLNGFGASGEEGGEGADGGGADMSSFFGQDSGDASEAPSGGRASIVADPPTAATSEASAAASNAEPLAEADSLIG
mmetsp:Transcript_15044/g.48215  ORF Transcript_15044/g.48215 Transcript_15044/m.48215 type:complete len:797 (+) Transcript_15044:317-2707(+)